MRSCATRVENLYGPTQTGFVANLSSPAFSAVGDMTMPDRSASTAVSGTNGVLSRIVTVDVSATSTPATLVSSLRRAGPVRVIGRSGLGFPAAASKGVPAGDLSPVRTVMWG